MVNYQKYVNAMFLGAGAIIWLISKHYIVLAMGYFQLRRSLGPYADLLEHALPIVLGLLTFLILRKNKLTANFTTDAVSELVKVTWPNAKDVRSGTVVVIITVLISGFLLGFLDLGLNSIIRFFIGT